MTTAKRPPALDERKLRFADLVPHAADLAPASLVAMLSDGRALVRANAVLALAASGHAVPELVPLLRDSDLHVATATAEAIGKLGERARGLVLQIATALDGAQPEIVETIVGTFAELVGVADAELVLALDLPMELAMKGVVAAAGRLGKRGIAFLVAAARHERTRIRVNAMHGLARFGKADIDAAMAVLTAAELNDPIPDVRSVAKQAALAVIAREKAVVVDHLPKLIPDFETRKLSTSELREATQHIVLDEMLYALQDGRAHVKINAARALGVTGEAASRAVKPLALLLRDSIAAVRMEVAKALGKLGPHAVDAAAELVAALGDNDEAVAEAAAATLGGLGDAATPALIRGLDAGTEVHGLRVGALFGGISRAADHLVEAFRSPAVNVQVNAAHALGHLGLAKIGAGLDVLLGARTGGDARTRDAVRRAIDRLDPKSDSGPRTLAIDGFETRTLDVKELEQHKAALEAFGLEELGAFLVDGRDSVRANAAAALGVLGAGAFAATLGVRLRDDAARVRLAAARALDRIGDAAVIATAADLVGALRDADEAVATAVGAALRARKGKVISALVRGLETDDARHARRICEAIAALPDAPEILADAFESPAVNVQVNAAHGLGALGKERIGRGRRLLEGARTGGWERTREAVRAALELLDGPKQVDSGMPAIPEFETAYLEPAVFDATKLAGNQLVPLLQDGRAVVRANAATALGAFGPAAAGAATALGVLLRDDELRVRIAAARALDKLGDDAVREIAAYLVGALRGDAEVAQACQPVLAARKTRVLSALLKGLETDDELHARRILEVIVALPDACEILCDAFESPAENVQVNAATGIGMLGANRAGPAGRKRLESARTGGFARTRESVFKALAVLNA